MATPMTVNTARRRNRRPMSRSPFRADLRDESVTRIGAQLALTRGSPVCQPRADRDSQREAARLRGVPGDRNPIQRLGLGVLLELLVVQRGVQAAKTEELAVRAPLDDAPVLEHEDAVRRDHRRQPVRDDDGRAVARERARLHCESRARAVSRGRPSPRRGSSTGGSLRMARAIATRCFSPPDSR